MYCRNCGSSIRDDAMFCPNCGTAVNGAPSQQQPYMQPAQPTYPYQQYNQQQPQNYQNGQPIQYPAAQNTNAIAIVGFVLAFIIPLAGLICSIIGFNNAKRGAPYYGLALAGIIISAVWMAMVLLAWIIVLSMWDSIWQFYNSLLY